MKVHIIFISIFLLLMLTLHIWYAFRDYGEWPWRSKKFWIGEARIGLVFVAIVSAILIVGGRYKNDSWFWETRSFFACDWGMSPQDVLSVENLSGRPSGTVAEPVLKPFGEQFQIMHAEKRHLYPLTQQKGRSARSYFFYNNALIAGCTYTHYRDAFDKVREQISHERRKNEIAYGDPVYTENDAVGVLLWDVDDRSYMGLVITVDEEQDRMTKRQIFMDKNLDMIILKIFIDDLIDAPDRINML